jgi:DNA-binding response OmpR family regulator
MEQPVESLSQKILIVDDHIEVQKLLEIVLRREGRKFLRARNGEEAIATARNERPEIILLDIMMPGGMDGLEVTRILKQDPATAKSFIITMTAKVQKKDRILAFQAGADDYISKPFNFSDLEKKIESLSRR